MTSRGGGSVGQGGLQLPACTGKIYGSSTFIIHESHIIKNETFCAFMDFVERKTMPKEFIKVKLTRIKIRFRYFFSLSLIALKAENM